MNVGTIEEMIAGPKARTVFEQFLSDEPVFTLEMQAEINQDGLAKWLMRQENIALDDEVFDWRTMPSVMRQVLMADIFQGLPLGMAQYAIPIRKLKNGRVFILAIMPQPTPPIRVTVNRPEPAHRPQFIDPPVPVLALGLATPELSGYQARLLKRVMEGNLEQVGTLLGPIVKMLAESENATISEALYYAVSMHNLITGAWRQFAHYWPMIEIEAILNRAVGTRSPVMGQQLIQDALIEGKPIAWGEPNQVLIAPANGN